MAGGIQTTLGDLVMAQPALKKLAALKLDPKTRYHVLKLSKLVTAEVKEHFYDERDLLTREMGETRAATPDEMAKVGSATIITVPHDKIQAYETAIKALLEVRVLIPWDPVTLPMLDAYLEFTADDFEALGPLGLMDVPPAAP